MKLKICFLFFLLFETAIGQYGPKNIAKSDRSLWILPMNSSTDFDIASKCEMLVFIEVFNEFSNYNENKLKEITKLKSINIQSVKNWQNKTKNILLENINSLENNALKSVIDIKQNNNWASVSNLDIKNKIPLTLKKWYQNSKSFYQNYVYEQIRLAALFPKITSEITTLNSNEVTGNEFEQKHFLLTFDDGPTSVNGNTDKMIEVLSNHNLKAVFYVLGDAFHNRKNATSSLKLQQLYNNQSVASHGKEHSSHQKSNTWKTSITFTNDVITSVFRNKQVDFRPPYGQRSKEISTYLEKEKAKIILWNLDSQDWNSNINANEIANRQITLMLLWRKGILLFHDIHPKAQKSVPIIYNYFKKCHINWVEPSYLNKF